MENIKNIIINFFITVIGMFNIFVFFILYDFNYWINNNKSYIGNEKQYETLINKIVKINILKVERKEKEIKYVLSKYSNVDVTLIFNNNDNINLGTIKIGNLKDYLNENVKQVKITFNYNGKKKVILLSKDEFKKLFNY